ncbi:hypothetical protein LLS1_18490 [Leifsonia sp. LS1]|uniref:phage tail tube protein n=1 Tax=Leifsonia sp. LS1 TaxID=2828483 RepID=UPI001CFCA5BD|nr:IPT/TIG domain-containing protein [Leifsonia sp. LS1]GIT80180.1 hypothetical protein LLS1_18490 [Leifsonia sp. LS1]
MGVDKTALIVPGHGTLFIADANTALPANPLTAFTLKGTPPSGWENIGHTSKDNTAAFNRDGGDATQLDSWLEDNVDTVYAATNWSLGFNPIQVDKNSLDLGFNGWVDPADGGYVIPSSQDGIDKALFLLATDGTGALGFYMPDTTISTGDAPSMDTSKFFEIPLSASIHAADEAVIASNGGKSGLMKVFKTGFTASKPLVKTATPTGAATGALVTITGSSFTGATTVKFSATNATAFTVISDGVIVAVVPSGTAGSAAVTVTNAAGVSNSLAYTRG